MNQHAPAAEFAMSFTQDAVLLERRDGLDWQLLGAADFDAGDIAGRLNSLRDSAGGHMGDLDTVLVIPDDQILYTLLTVPVGSDTATAVGRALEGMTPYRADELAFDWCPSANGDIETLRVAAVARKTLQEAEDFARAQGFRASGFQARPNDDRFDGQPDFGPSVLAQDSAPRRPFSEPDLSQARVTAATIDDHSDDAGPVVSRITPHVVPAPAPKPVPVAPVAAPAVIRHGQASEKRLSPRAAAIHQRAAEGRVNRAQPDDVVEKTSALSRLSKVDFTRLPVMIALLLVGLMLAMWIFGRDTGQQVAATEQAPAPVETAVETVAEPEPAPVVETPVVAEPEPVAEPIVEPEPQPEPVAEVTPEPAPEPTVDPPPAPAAPLTESVIPPAAPRDDAVAQETPPASDDPAAETLPESVTTETPPVPRPDTPEPVQDSTPVAAPTPSVSATRPPAAPATPRPAAPEAQADPLRDALDQALSPSAAPSLSRSARPPRTSPAPAAPPATPDVTPATPPNPQPFEQRSAAEPPRVSPARPAARPASRPAAATPAPTPAPASEPAPAATPPAAPQPAATGARPPARPANLSSLEQGSQIEADAPVVLTAAERRTLEQQLRDLRTAQVGPSGMTQAERALVFQLADARPARRPVSVAAPSQSAVSAPAQTQSATSNRPAPRGAIRAAATAPAPDQTATPAPRASGTVAQSPRPRAKPANRSAASSPAAGNASLSANAVETAIAQAVADSPAKPGAVPLAALTSSAVPPRRSARASVPATAPVNAIAASAVPVAAAATAATQQRAASARNQQYRPPEAEAEPELVAAVPQSAIGSAAASATVKDGIRLNSTQIIGTIGAGQASRALVRLSNGRILTLRIGDQINGGRITEIKDSRIIYNKGGRAHALGVLGGQ
ncbi:hypothetical protein [Paracoccus sp. (in: a-proteobacteria)]|uniref:hypothetical protein n=1 Tax=Paracoccus sp. TaxID=267 RepID=UPI0026E0DAE2|nr:hypothetical protein [Paracoccus sp. (in: a-proteobacteria)]MDO5646697.1 hypothetical protein [Paracoccus sp. (in: a-proteobacteria)]